MQRSVLRAEITLDRGLIKTELNWLKENKYSYGGDQSTLDFYIKKKWFFTVKKSTTVADVAVR